MTTTRALVLVHGGAGVMRSLAGERADAYRAGLAEAARVGREVLAEGGSALDAVQAATRSMEADGAFNAGVGACLDEDGCYALDAALMNGANRAAGAVGAASGTRHPIDTCRDLLDEGRHVLLVGEGADRRSRRLGLPALPAPPADKLATFAQLKAKTHASPEELSTVGRPDDEGVDGAADAAGVVGGGDRRADAAGVVGLGDAGASRPCADEAAAGASGDADVHADSQDTVGAVAVDAEGRVAAAVSTGGLWLKAKGRVGDSAIVGAGLMACDELGAAASATGIGERMIRGLTCQVACAIAARVGAAAAAEQASADMVRRFGEGSGGLIVVDRRGQVGVAFNTRGMGRALARVGEAQVHVAIWPEEPFPAQTLTH